MNMIFIVALILFLFAILILNASFSTPLKVVLIVSILEIIAKLITIYINETL